ncbi:MAG: 2-C-methyl-D-erythritol 2,4-cyclodiphosphate synthase, partial [Pyramidobacter sp.]|nr:2-C-methyl-D-erythritol 2,4-cyclodiphosphate synthase [Pyramidobacter sp.]
EALRASSCEAVLLHDAARPFLDAALCERLLAAFRGDNAVVPLLPEANALKRVDENGVTPVDRDGLYITQTPQLFPRVALLELLDRTGEFACKDEAELWLQNGKQLDWVSGSQKNFKVTERGDWEMACELAGEGAICRCGLGYDVHPLTPGRPLVLGGVVVPSRLGLEGHSDADALAHAVSDAILSTAGLPDIGTLYPASDERYKGIYSMELLADAVSKARERGWRVEWISAVLTAQTPRLAPWKEAIVRSLESVLGEGRVSVTFKSGEGVGPAGTARAVFVWASATMRKSRDV